VRAELSLEEVRGGYRCESFLTSVQTDATVRAGALLIPRPAHLGFLSGDVDVRRVTDAGGPGEAPGR